MKVFRAVGAHDKAQGKKRGQTAALFIASALVGAFAVAVPAAASANVDFTGYVDNPRGYVVHHDKARPNSYQQNYVAWSPYSNSCNYTMVLGIRNSSGTQIARSQRSAFDVGTGAWFDLTKPNGSNQIPQGVFYLNSMMDNFSGNGNQPAVCTWSADLQFNIQNY